MSGVTYLDREGVLCTVALSEVAIDRTGLTGVHPGTGLAVILVWDEDLEMWTEGS